MSSNFGAWRGARRQISRRIASRILEEIQGEIAPVEPEEALTPREPEVLVLLVLGGGPGSHGPGRHSATEAPDIPDPSSRSAVQERTGRSPAATVDELAANADEVFFPDRFVVTVEGPVATALTSSAARRAVAVGDEVDAHLATPWSGPFVPMAPGLPKFMLTVHLITSVGWIGAVAAYIALDITATSSQDVQAVRGVYLTMELVPLNAIVPFALAPLLTGLVMSLGTPWGLFRHYRILITLMLTVLAAVVLLLETRTISSLADAAASAPDPRGLPGSLVHSVGGLAVLLVITVLTV